MEFRVLGPIEVSVGGAVVPLRGARQRTLLASLLLSPGAPVGQSRLIDLLWGDAPPRTASSSLRVHLSQLRRSMGPAAACVRTAGSAYLVDVPNEAVDARRFEALLAAALQKEDGDARAAYHLLEQALSLWRGPAFADAGFATGPEPDVERLEELRLHALEKRMELAIVLNRHREVIPELEALVACHPFREALWGHLLVALYRAGRQADALRRYHELRVTLREELGIDPSPDLQRLEKAILGQSAELLAHTHPTGDARRTNRTSALATRSVTFLLTDIVSSTPMWVAEPAMGTAVARHEEIICTAVTEQGGTVLKPRGEGDSTFSVFSGAAAAMRAAIAIQGAVASETWPTQNPLEVRIAIHTGDAEVRDGDYFGVEVSRAARLRSLAHGGQILVSAATAGLLDGMLPADVRLEHLGEHRLAGFDRASAVLQLSASGLRHRFPPLAGVATPHNLPASVTGFVGREAELGDLLALIEVRRLVTIVGAGGAGKTRLALELTRSVADRFPDGSWLVDLYALGAGVGDVHGAVAAAIGVREEPGVAMADAVHRHVASRRLLIVMDNCEHVIDAAARAASQLLAAGDGVRVLATSREPLDVEGEALYRLHPLTVPGEAVSDLESIGASDAVALFVDRMRAVDTRFVLHGGNAPTVSAICRRLDGIPLALELVAARAYAMTVDELLQALEDRFTLTEGRRGTSERHRGLAAVVDWSFQLLSPVERDALCRLSVFAASFTLGAGASVADVAPDVLRRLADKSLLETRHHGSTSRFSLLETVRAHATAQLSMSDRRSAAGRHLDWYRQEAREAAGRLEGPEAEATLDALEADQHEHRVALEFGLAHDARRACDLALWLTQFWSMRGHMTEGLRWLQAAIAVAPDDGIRARLLTATGNFLVRLGHGSEGVRLLRRALGLQRDAGDEARAGYTLAWLANAELKQGHIDAGRRYLDEATAIAARLTEDRLTALIAGARGDGCRAEGCLVEAAAHYRRALEIAAARGDRHAEAQALLNLGDTAAAGGSDPEASARYDAALALFDQLGDRSCASVVLDRLAERATSAGRYRDAIRLQARALAARLGLGERKDAARSVAALARLAAMEENPALAARLLGAVHALTGSLDTVAPDTAADEAEAAAVRAALGDEEYRRTWAAGYHMSERDLADVVALMSPDG